MFIEIAVIVKDEERDYKKKFDPFASKVITEEMIVQCITETLKEFKSEPDDVKVRVTIQV